MSILCFGEITSDHLILADEFPLEGSTALLGEREMPGGSALNTAFLLHHWQIPVHLAGNPLGEDSKGEFIEAYLKLKEISHSVISTGEISTPRCICLVNRQEKSRSFVLNVRGARHWDPRQMEGLSLADYSHAFVDTYLGKAALEVLEELEKGECWTLTQDLSAQSRLVGKTKGVQISLDSRDFRKDNFRGLAGDYLVGKTEWVIFTGGKKGAAAVSREEIHLRKARAAEVIDTTGCGDAFRAGVLYGLKEGYSWPQILELACQVGARNAEFLGSHGEIDLPKMTD